MAVIYFGGCSFSMGAGFDQEIDDHRIYPNIVGSELGYQVINEAEGGSSNLKIFIRAAKALIENVADIYVLQWSALHRHWLYPTPDSGLYLGGSWENTPNSDFIKRFQQLNHDYGNIMQLIDFCRIIYSMSQMLDRQVIFVNGLLPWTQDLLCTDLPTSSYVEELLKDLAPEDRQEFKSRITNNLELLEWQSWANPWNSMWDMKIDDAPLDDHPGPETHKLIARNVVDAIRRTQCKKNIH